MRRIPGRTLVATLLVAGCVGPLAFLAGAGRAHGDPIDPGRMPTEAECNAIIRLELDAAKRIRGELLIDDIEATDAAVAAAARDPRANLTMLGVPVTAAELDVLEEAGIRPGPTGPLTFWVEFGGTGRFGGFWPEDDTFVVSIVRSDPGSLALARCLAPPDTRFVHAVRSIEEVQALHRRIAGDWDELRGLGVELNSAAESDSDGVVVVTVTTVTDEVVALLHARYGDAVLVMQGGPIDQ